MGDVILCFPHKPNEITGSLKRKEGSRTVGDKKGEVTVETEVGVMHFEVMRRGP